MQQHQPLIVTQQLIIGADLYLQMRKNGFDVIGICNSSADTLDIINNMKPSVVLIDISLKGAINGLQLARILKIEYQMPVILLNPGMEPRILDEAKSIKPQAIIHIPYRTIDLKNALGLVKISQAKKIEFPLKAAI